MVTWVIGLSGAGKTTLAKLAYEKLKPDVKNLVFVDGDEFREIMQNDTGHSIEERRKNADRIGRFCHFLDRQDIHVICAILSIFPESWAWNRENFSEYVDVLIDVPLEELKRRDSKGLYAKAESGEIANVVGIDIPFKPPEHPSLIIQNGQEENAQEKADLIVDAIRSKF